MIFTKNHRVTRGELLRRLIPATCRSDLSPSVSRPLLAWQQNVFLLRAARAARLFLHFESMA